MVKIWNIRKGVLLVLFWVLVFSFGLNAKGVFAQRKFVYDWYIRSFDATITLNKDSSLDVTERISADCGNAAGKHGIFRTLPEEIKIEGGKKIKTPVTLISITNFSGEPYKYKTISRNDTITWKIGDPHKTVQGTNNYFIHYKVGNVIRFGNSSFDEFYWNILGAFWDLEIDNFHAKLIFPKEISKENTQIEYYTGYFGSKEKNLASYFWTSPNVLEFNSIRPLKKRQGITVSITFPKSIFSPYHFGFRDFWELYVVKYFYFIIPLISFIVCFYLWRKYGKDPHLQKSIIPIYKPPENLTPLEIGVLKEGGEIIKKEFITGEIINLAVKGLITIKETEKKFLLFNSNDYSLIRNNKPEIEESLTSPQKFILKKIFEEGDEVKLSSLKKIKFYEYIKNIQEETRNLLVQKKLITRRGINLGSSFRTVSILLFVVFYFLGFFLNSASNSLFAVTLLSAAIIFIFSFFMPRRTLKGAEVNWKIRGFKLFMKTVDKDRAKFYEKENIFEKFLPYAIVFGITDIWIKRMKEIYGEEYFVHYAPGWYRGTAPVFDSKSFSSNIAGLTSAIGAGISSPSGVGGAGGAGGGGGGGGGGGW